MTITIEQLSSVKKKINFEIPADRVVVEIENVYGKIRKHASLKGFRKGKVPQAMVEKHFSGAMEEDVLKNLVNETYFKALEENDIAPLAYPVIDSDPLKKGEPLRYSATVEVMPDIEVKDYLGLEVKKEKLVSDEEVVNKRLQEMRESMAQMQPVDEARASALGDFVQIDFTGFIDEQPIEHGAAEDHLLELGSNQFIPGFEEQIVGMKVGEERKITVSFPDEYGNKDLSGKEATFDVKVKEVKVKELPELDDEFAKQFGEFETLDELKAKIREMHEKQELERIDADLNDQLVKALIEKNEIDVPDVMVDRQLQIMLENMKRRLASQNLTFEMMGMDEKTFGMQYRSVAETQVKGALLLEAIADKESITVEDADLERKIVEIAERNNQNVEAVKNYYLKTEQVKEGLAHQLREDKTLELLKSKAVITEAVKEEL